MHPIVVQANRVVESLNKLHHPIDDILRAGADVALPEGFPWQLTDELVCLYQWRNGTDTQGRILDDLHFFPGFYFLSFEDAMQHWRAFKADARWLPNWFPVFANGGGDFYVLPLKEVKTPECEVVGFVLGEADHFVEYASLTKMIETIADCYAAGAYFLKENYLEVDTRIEHTVGHALNPGLSRWRA